MHPFDQLAVGHARQGEEHVVAAHQVVDGQDGVQAKLQLLGLTPLLLVARPQLALDVAAQTLERRGGQHRFG